MTDNIKSETSGYLDHILGNTTVVHCTHDFDIATGKQAFDVWIARPSKWGNPYRIGKDGTREEVLKKYKKYLRSRPDLIEDAKRELKGKRLGCYCSPLPCHGDILAQAADGFLVPTKGRKSMATKTMKEMLKHGKKAWRRAKKEKVVDFPRLPDGDYIGKLATAEVRISSKDNLGASFGFTIVRGDETGKPVYVWYGLDDEAKFPRLMSTLRLFGVDMDDVELEDLEDALKTLLKEGHHAKLKLNTDSNDNQWTKIIEVIDLDDEEDSDDEDRAPEKGDTVTFEVDDEAVEGEVVKVNEDEETCTVKVGKKKHKGIDWDDIEIVKDEEEEEEEEEEDLDEGTRVSYESPQGIKRGVVTDCEDTTVTIKVDGGKGRGGSVKRTVSQCTVLENEEEEDRDPVKGDLVSVQIKGKKGNYEGEVIKVSKKKETCEVRVSKKTYTYAFDDVEIVEDDYEED